MRGGIGGEGKAEERRLSILYGEIVIADIEKLGSRNFGL